MSRTLPNLLRRHIAPPRFVLFALILAALLIGTAVAGMSLQIALLASFDLATLVFLVSLAGLFDDDAAAMRLHAVDNDTNRVGLLAIAVLTLLVVLIAIGTLVAARQGVSGEIPLILGSLVLAWAFANSVFALHYAHIFYQQADGDDQGGLDFPKTPTPDYWDFFYFSFTLGMTFQTSDVVITGAHMRRIVLAHTITAFLFNLGILAFAINIIGSL